MSRVTIALGGAAFLLGVLTILSSISALLGVVDFNSLTWTDAKFPILALLALGLMALVCGIVMRR
ncbi:MAG: hypothetical protein ACE5OY_04065 [Candidatus Bathyarchaeia archaeon]